MFFFKTVYTWANKVMFICENPSRFTSYYKAHTTRPYYPCLSNLLITYLTYSLEPWKNLPFYYVTFYVRWALPYRIFYISRPYKLGDLLFWTKQKFVSRQRSENHWFRMSDQVMDELHAFCPITQCMDAKYICSGQYHVIGDLGTCTRAKKKPTG